MQNNAAHLIDMVILNTLVLTQQNIKIKILCLIFSEIIFFLKFTKILDLCMFFYIYLPISQAEFSFKKR